MLQRNVLKQIKAANKEHFTIAFWTCSYWL